MFFSRFSSADICPVAYICAGQLTLYSLMKYEPFPTPCEGMKHPSADCNSSPALFVAAEIIKTTQKLRHSLCGFLCGLFYNNPRASNGEMISQ
jgi:hypothetical protein